MRQAPVFLISNLDATASRIFDRLAPRHIKIVVDAALGEGRHPGFDDFDVAQGPGRSLELVSLRNTSFEELDVIVSEADLVILAGGNTFVLLDAIRRSGFDTLLDGRPDLPVIGESAGAIVLGRDIAHAAGIDDASAAPTLSSTRGLGWCDDLVVPHLEGQAYGLGDTVAAWLAQEPDPDRYTLIHEDGILCLDADGGRRQLGTPAPGRT